MDSRTLRARAAIGCTFRRHCILGLQLGVAALLATGCAGGWPGAGPRGLAVVSAPAPSSVERYCAWYGDASEGVLYFGQAAFWSAMRAAEGEPVADLARPGPQLVGRFDLAREALLPPLQVGGGEARSGVWDVLALPDGRVFFTSFFESAGAVDPDSGEVERFPELGAGLNELAPGPEGSVLVTRYGSGQAEGDGELLAVSERGALVAQWPLPPPPGFRMAPKTPAWDASRQRLWVTTDLLPDAPGAADRHDAYVLAAGGELLARIDDRELHFAAAGPDGALLLAELAGSELRLRVLPAPGGGAVRSILLDPLFPAALDFAQDIQTAADGRVVVTRWSGQVHVVHPDGRVGTVQLPRLDPDGLYYTGVLHGERLCVTYCADVTVVCTDAP